jgi:FixJ family two-component response regulator
MPNMGGLELAERFRQRQPQAKILFMSAYSDHPLAAGGPKAAGIHFVPKPFTPRGLAGKVREALSA